MSAGSNAPVARGPLLLERSDPNSPVRRALRVGGVLAGALGAFFLYGGLSSRWVAVQTSPWEWHGAGLLGPGLAYLFVLFAGGAVVLTGLGCTLLAVAWAALDVRRPRAAGSPDPEQLHRARVPRA